MISTTTTKSDPSPTYRIYAKLVGKNLNEFKKKYVLAKTTPTVKI